MVGCLIKSKYPPSPECSNTHMSGRRDPACGDPIQIHQRKMRETVREIMDVLRRVFSHLHCKDVSEKRLSTKRKWFFSLDTTATECIVNEQRMWINKYENLEGNLGTHKQNASKDLYPDCTKNPGSTDPFSSKTFTPSSKTDHYKTPKSRENLTNIYTFLKYMTRKKTA